MNRVSLSFQKYVERGIDQVFNNLQNTSDLFENRHVASRLNDTWASSRDISVCTQPATVEAVLRYVKKFNSRKIMITGVSTAERVEHVIQSARLGLGKSSLDNIEIVGISLDEALGTFRRRSAGKQLKAWSMRS